MSYIGPNYACFSGVLLKHFLLARAKTKSAEIDDSRHTRALIYLFEYIDTSLT